MNRVALLGVALLAAAPPPQGKALRILVPRFFDGWQAENVSYPFVIFVPEDRLYRMYYTGSGSAQRNESVWDFWATGAVSSTDTITWKHPGDCQPVVFPRRLREGAVVDPEALAATFDSVFAYAACVATEGQGYGMWYTGWNGSERQLGGGVVEKVRFRIGHATSSAASAWKKRPGAAGAGAVVGLGGSGDPDSMGASHPYVLRERGVYRMWYEAYDGNMWRIAEAASLDGQSWMKLGVVLSPGGDGAPDERGTRNPVVILRGGRYELWYEGRSRLSPHYHTLRATSARLGTSWTKVPAEVSLHPDGPLGGDEEVYVNSIIVGHDGRCQVFFAREEWRHDPSGAPSNKSFSIYTETVNPG